MENKNLICSSCGHANSAKRVTRGTFLAEVALWLVAIFLIFVIPLIGGVLIVVAIIYSVWRLLSRRTECRHCGNTNLIPADSPMGEKLNRDLRESQNKP